MKYCFIRNPRAGPIRDRAELPALLAGFIARHRLDATIATTQHRGNATELARAAVAGGCDVVVAVGGDGTMNEVARALVGTSATLGLIPRGSGNGLARHLRIPLAPAAALGALLACPSRLIDVGEANSHPFFCAMGVGFDTAVLAHFERHPKRGFAAYVAVAARLFASYRCASYTVAGDDGSAITGPALLVAVMNCAQLGNDAWLAPRAQVDDGRLDLVVVPPLSFVTGLPLLGRLFNGSIDRAACVQHRTMTRLTIGRAAAGPIHVDGELVETTPEVSITIRPASLRVHAPLVST